MKSELNKENINNLVVRTELENIEPTLYQVLVHNDDFTPMEFVVKILEKFFYLNRRKATEVMLEAHMIGKGGCGLFTKDVAETKISQVIDYARANEFPLLCSMEAA